MREFGYLALNMFAGWLLFMALSALALIFIATAGIDLSDFAVVALGFIAGNLGATVGAFAAVTREL